MGRRTKLTPELQESFLELVRAGNYYETACAYVGVSEATFYRWMQRGEKSGKSNRIYRVFREAVESARASAAMESLARIRQAGDRGSWQADAWYLERSYPDRYGRRVRQDVRHSGGEEPVKLKLIWDIPPASNGGDK